MTVAEKLLELGIRCPCGGEVDVIKYIGDPLCYGMRCHKCGSMTGEEYGELVEETLTAWLILTGGPVPGEVPPPMWSDRATVAVFLVDAGGVACYMNGTGWRYAVDLAQCNTPGSDWYFIDRDESIIRPWLESEWREA